MILFIWQFRLLNTLIVRHFWFEVAFSCPSEQNVRRWIEVELRLRAFDSDIDMHLTVSMGISLIGDSHGLGSMSRVRLLAFHFIVLNDIWKLHMILLDALFNYYAILKGCLLS
jgi:hypothetical protein